MMDVNPSALFSTKCDEMLLQILQGALFLANIEL